MFAQLDALSIVRFHDDMLALESWPGEPGQFGSAHAWQSVHANHLCNTLLWREEDKARRTDVGEADIAAGKRLIDRYNQQRSDAVEAVDEAILVQLCGVPLGDGARLSSETAGAMIDRLSILSLKIFHMREQTLRTDAPAAHIDGCCAKLRRLVAQRADLACCLDQLLADAQRGQAYFKVYRQFRMHNDPSLNPYLYGAGARVRAQ